MSNDKNPFSDIILYSSPEGKVKVEVVFSGEIFWLTQKRMAELFGCSTDNISLHLKNIFDSKELNFDSVTGEFPATGKLKQHNGKRK